ncbi:MAG: hypothetical protein D6731_01705 [Planctomycetota bacterium]|nr:MAG: hypothetical protein D6731_01705 [Planctomycetota bacterium]
MGALNRLYRQFGERVAFYVVYIREAHAADSRWPDPRLQVKTPRTFGERLGVAKTCSEALGIDFPLLVDGLDDAVERAYRGWPDRLYLVGRDGRVAYRGGRGPWGFSPDALRKAIESELAACDRPSGSVEARSYRFEAQVDFRNEPVKNRFVFSERGIQTEHRAPPARGVRRTLVERRIDATQLAKVVLNGAELPAAVVESRLRGLFGEPHRELRLERRGEDTASADETIARSLSQQYTDRTLLEALARLCVRDRARLRAHAQGADRVTSWAPPAVYAAFRYEESAAPEGARRIVVRSEGARGPAGGSGRRTLRAFRCEFLLGAEDEALRSLVLDATLYNEAKRIETRLVWRQELASPAGRAAQAGHPAPEALAALCDAVDVANRGHPEAAAAACADLSLPGALGETVAELRSRWRRTASGVRWTHHRLPPALADARASRRPLLVLFDQDGCPPCAILRRQVLERPEFAAAVGDRAVLLNLNACNDEALARRYGVAGTPTLLVLDADGEAIARQEGIHDLASSLAFVRAALAQAAAKGARAHRRYF